MSDRKLHVLTTMDCETPEVDLPDHAIEKSGTGPADYGESRHTIQSFVDAADEMGYTATLFTHPSLARKDTEFMLDLADGDVGFGMHVHPYKLIDAGYRRDLGAYTAAEQRDMLAPAVEDWEASMGTHPGVFRGGKHSANDATAGVLRSLGFEGGNVSIPGRIHPHEYTVWAGSPPDPYRMDGAFRFAPGEEFIEVPVTVDFERPLADNTGTGSPTEGYEWGKIEGDYDFEAVARNTILRIAAVEPAVPVVHLTTHNSVDYGAGTAREHLEMVYRTIEEEAPKAGYEPVDATVSEVVETCREAL